VTQDADNEGAAFAAESRRLIAQRLPLGAGALVGVFAVAWVLEHQVHPDRDWHYAIIYGCEILTLGVALLLSRQRRWAERTDVLAVVTAVALTFQVGLYHVLVGGEGEVLSIALLYLTTGTMVLIPWGWQGQLPVAVVAFLTYVGAVALGARSATPLAINILGLGTMSALSVGGAAFMAHQRWALWQQTAALRAANVALEEANRAKNQFVANVSHELRTPLNIFVGYTDLLLEGAYGPLSADAREVLERMARNARQLVFLTNDLLDLARIEVGRLTVHVVPVEVEPVVAEMTRFVEPRLDGKDVRFHSELQPHLQVMADRTRLEQILVNLLSNATKFTERGEIRLRASTVPGDRVMIEVQDTGVGIAAADLPKIFRPFSQGESGKTHGGVGIGLSLSWALAHAMGGELTVRSVPGEGSTFMLHLNAAHGRRPPSP
jgi:signal transduction histidine kinase